MAVQRLLLFIGTVW